MILPHEGVRKVSGPKFFFHHLPVWISLHPINNMLSIIHSVITLYFRFIVKHFKTGYQELYEVSLHNNWETAKVVEMKQLKAEVKRQMALQGDYKVRPVTIYDLQKLRK